MRVQTSLSGRKPAENNSRIQNKTPRTNMRVQPSLSWEETSRKQQQNSEQNTQNQHESTAIFILGGDQQKTTAEFRTKHPEPTWEYSHLYLGRKPAENNSRIQNKTPRTNMRVQPSLSWEETNRKQQQNSEQNTQNQHESTAIFILEGNQQKTTAEFRTKHPEPTWEYSHLYLGRKPAENNSRIQNKTPRTNMRVQPSLSWEETNRKQQQNSEQNTQNQHESTDIFILGGNQQKTTTEFRTKYPEPTWEYRHLYLGRKPAENNSRIQNKTPRTNMRVQPSLSWTETSRKQQQNSEQNTQNQHESTAIFILGGNQQKTTAEFRTKHPEPTWEYSHLYLGRKPAENNSRIQNKTPRTNMRVQTSLSWKETSRKQQQNSEQNTQNQHESTAIFILDGNQQKTTAEFRTKHPEPTWEYRHLYLGRRPAENNSRIQNKTPRTNMRVQTSLSWEETSRKQQQNSEQNTQNQHESTAIFILGGDQQKTTAEFRTKHPEPTWEYRHLYLGRRPAENNSRIQNKTPRTNMRVQPSLSWEETSRKQQQNSEQNTQNQHESTAIFILGGDQQKTTAEFRTKHPEPTWEYSHLYLGRRPAENNSRIQNKTPRTNMRVQPSLSWTETSRKQQQNSEQNTQNQHESTDIFIWEETSRKQQQNSEQNTQNQHESTAIFILGGNQQKTTAEFRTKHPEPTWEYSHLYLGRRPAENNSRIQNKTPRTNMRVQPSLSWQETSRKQQQNSEQNTQNQHESTAIFILAGDQQKTTVEFRTKHPEHNMRVQPSLSWEETSRKQQQNSEQNTQNQHESTDIFILGGNQQKTTAEFRTKHPEPTWEYRHLYLGRKPAENNSRIQNKTPRTNMRVQPSLSWEETSRKQQQNSEQNTQNQHESTDIFILEGNQQKTTAEFRTKHPEPTWEYRHLYLGRKPAENNNRIQNKTSRTNMRVQPSLSWEETSRKQQQNSEQTTQNQHESTDIFILEGNQQKTTAEFRTKHPEPTWEYRHLYLGRKPAENNNRIQNKTSRTNMRVQPSLSWEETSRKQQQNSEQNTQNQHESTDIFILEGNQQKTTAEFRTKHPEPTWEYSHLYLGRKPAENNSRIQNKTPRTNMRVQPSLSWKETSRKQQQNSEQNTQNQHESTDIFILEGNQQKTTAEFRTKHPEPTWEYRHLYLGRKPAENNNRIQNKTSRTNMRVQPSLSWEETSRKQQQNSEQNTQNQHESTAIFILGETSRKQQQNSEQNTQNQHESTDIFILGGNQQKTTAEFRTKHPEPTWEYSHLYLGRRPAENNSRIQNKTPRTNMRVQTSLSWEETSRKQQQNSEQNTQNQHESTAIFILGGNQQKTTVEFRTKHPEPTWEYRHLYLGRKPAENNSRIQNKTPRTNMRVQTSLSWEETSRKQQQNSEQNTQNQHESTAIFILDGNQQKTTAEFRTKHPEPTWEYSHLYLGRRPAENNSRIQNKTPRTIMRVQTSLSWQETSRKQQ